MKRFLSLLLMFPIALSCLALAAEQPLKTTKSQPVTAPAAPDIDKIMAAALRHVVLTGTLKDALDQFSRLVGVPVFTDWGILEAVGVKRTAAVSLRVDKVRADQVLESLLVRVAKKGKPLAWYVDRGLVIVTTQQRVLARKRRAQAGQAYRGRIIRRAPRGKPHGFQFENTPLVDVLAAFREAIGANFHVNWRSLKAVGIDRNTPVTLKLKGASIWRALDLVIEQLSEGRNKYESVYWIIDGGVLSIATGNSFNNKTRITVHDVADLLAAVPNFKGPRMKLSQAGEDKEGEGDTLFDSDEDTESTETGGAQTREAIQQTLTEIIKDSIGHDIWAPQGKGSIRFLGNQIVISQTLLGYKLMQKAGAIR